MNYDLEPGNFVLFERGYYSEKTNLDHVVAVKYFSLSETLEAYKEQFVPDDEYDRADQYGFIAWLIINGYVIPVECREIHLGEFDDLKIR